MINGNRTKIKERIPKIDQNKARAIKMSNGDDENEHENVDE